jgi:hypothetical protein
MEDLRMAYYRWCMEKARTSMGCNTGRCYTRDTCVTENILEYILINQNK